MDRFSDEISYSQVHVFFAYFRGLGTNGLYINPWSKPVKFDSNGFTAAKENRSANNFLQYLSWQDMASFIKV